MSLEAQTPEERIMDEIYAERARQIEKGWSHEHDDEHGAGHLVQEARGRMNRYGNDGKYLVKPYQRKLLLEAATLLVAAIESIDRQKS